MCAALRIRTALTVAYTSRYTTRMIRRHSLGMLLVLVAAICVSCRDIRPPKGVTPIERTMTVTGYCKCRQCCGWRRTWYGKPVYASGRNEGKRKRIGITASGARAEHGTIAADSRYPFGTIMYVPGYGYGQVTDRGGAIKNDRIDLFFRSHAEARRWGKEKKQVKIWLP